MSEGREAGFQRSQDSLNFEAMWRGLPRRGSLPERRAFQPRLARVFLRNLILMQAPSENDLALRIRLVGDAIRSVIAGDILGQDYFDFLAPERRAPALALVRDLFARPCGLWFVAPVHYARGYSQLWELTAFPLAGSGRTPATVLGLVSPLGTTLTPETVDHDMLRIDRARRLELIALGP